MNAYYNVGLTKIVCLVGEIP